MTCLSKTAAMWLALLALLWLPLSAYSQKSVYLEELTTQEVSTMLKNSPAVVIIPVGGTEQNGPHMALGKHNARVKVLTGRIATQLTLQNINTIVAPVVSYAPQGSINPPTEHMAFAGTISISDDAFKSVLLSAARSFKQHGFTDIVLLGDSGNYQTLLSQVAQTFNQNSGKSTARLHFIADYYKASQSAYIAALKARGLTEAEIGTHAGSADTSLLMAAEPHLVKPEKFTEAAKLGWRGGTLGDPRASSAALGQIGLDTAVKMSVLAIQKAILK